MTHHNGYEKHHIGEWDRACEIQLACGTGTGSKIFTSSADAPFQLAYVSVDASCLNRQDVLIKFSSSIKIDLMGQGRIVRLKYELFRVCDHREPTSLGIWRFEREYLASESLEETFSFVFCDNLNHEKCCDYFVTVTPVDITEIQTTVTVYNGQMAALSQQHLCQAREDESKTHDSHDKENLIIHKSTYPKCGILTCGQGNGSVNFRPSNFFAPSPSVSLAHINMDTTCLDKATILIEFSSIVNIGLSTQAQFEFQLFRVCGNEEPLSRGIWKFKRTNDSSEKSFNVSFIFCDTNVPSSCCEYFVQVTPQVESFNFDEAALINNVRLTGIAQSSRKYCPVETYERDEIKGDSSPYETKHPKPKGILLACGSGTGMNTFTSSSDTSFQLAHVTIDTTCLCKPMVNIEFSSMLSTDFEQRGSLQLRYELIRICQNRKPITIAVWDFDHIDRTLIVESTEAFDFTYCDCMSCSGCCDYVVAVTPIILQDGSVTVSNGRIAALVQES